MSSAAPAAVETAVPAAPSAAPPSAPSAAVEDNRSPDDILDSLKQNTIAWGHGKPQDAPAEPNSATPAQTAEGNTPPTDAPAPAPSSAHQDWIKQYGGDPEKAGVEAFALQKRASEMARKLKEYESAQPAPAPAAPQAATPVAPAPTPTAPTPQAQPAQPTATPTIQDQALEHALANDEKCRDLIAQHNANVAQLTKLNNEEIPTLRQQIVNSNAVIAHPDVDELVKDNARAALQRAEMTLAAREAVAERLNLKNMSLDLDFRNRVGGFVSQLEGQSAERAREAESEKDAEAKAQEFVGHWPSVFDTVFKEQGIDPDMRDDIHSAVKTAALARPGRIDLKDLKPFMDEAIKAEHAKMDKYHRGQARAYALKKTADTTPAAPTGAAATAPPLPQTDDPEAAIERLRLGTRQAFAARRSAR